MLRAGTARAPFWFLLQTTQLAKIAAVQTAAFGRTEIILIKPKSRPHVAIMEVACPPSNLPLNRSPRVAYPLLGTFRDYRLPISHVADVRR